MKRKLIECHLEEDEDHTLEPSVYIQRFNFDAMFEVGREVGVIEQIEEAFRELCDYDELYEPNTYLCVLIKCTNPKAVSQKILETLCREFRRFTRMVVVFISVSYQSKCRVGLLLSSLGMSHKVEYFTLNGSAGIISEELETGSIYLNRYAPPEPKVTRPK